MGVIFCSRMFDHAVLNKLESGRGSLSILIISTRLLSKIYVKGRKSELVDSPVVSKEYVGKPSYFGITIGKFVHNVEPCR